jgi:hypothetical protein
MDGGRVGRQKKIDPLTVIHFMVFRRPCLSFSSSRIDKSLRSITSARVLSGIFYFLDFSKIKFGTCRNVGPKYFYFLFSKGRVIS